MLLKNVLFALLVVTAFFTAGEFILAMAGVQPSRTTEDPFFGFAGNIPLFVEKKLPDGSTTLRTADNKLELFNYQEFPREKGERTYRIFCMGGSTTFGRPYLDRVSFCGWLRAYLKAADPGRDWEVINAGGVSYASYRVARLMTELVQYQPDLFIVYSGQNEFLEQRSYGGLIDLPAWVIDLNAVLSGTRVYTAMSRAIDAVKPGSSRLARQRNVLNGEVDEILNHTIGPQSYHRDEVLRQQIIRHYRLNLERMVRIARDADAGIIFIRPAVNIKDMSPFKSEHRAELDAGMLERWQSLYDQAGALEAKGRHGAALDLYRQALAIDDRYAELHFRMGRVLFGLGRYDESEQAFRRAVEEDVAPLRILEPMQQAVTETAESSNVPLVDFSHLLADVYRSRYGHTVFGKKFFVDHVHTNVEGYRLLGLALFEKMVALDIATPGASWDRAHLDAVNRDVLTGLDRAEEGHALMKLGKVMEWAGKAAEAYPLFQQALEILGPDPSRYDQLARTAYLLGLRDESIRYLEAILELVPTAGGVHSKLAVMFAEEGRTAEAIGHCQAELLLRPDDYIVRARLAELLEKQGDDTAALEQYRRVLEASPGLARAHLKLAYLLFRLDRGAEALEHGREALRIDPTLYRAHNVLGLLMMRQGNTAEAVRHFREALRLEPGYREARHNLDRLQIGLDSRGDAFPSRESDG